jgi:hypothetical protein
VDARTDQLRWQSTGALQCGGAQYPDVTKDVPRQMTSMHTLFSYPARSPLTATAAKAERLTVASSKPRSMMVDSLGASVAVLPIERGEV